MRRQRALGFKYDLCDPANTDQCDDDGKQTMQSLLCQAMCHANSWRQSLHRAGVLTTCAHVCRYDLFGSNFQVPLRLALTSMSMDEEDMQGMLIPDSELPELPGELCGIWAYIQWESAGCPNRSKAESDAEYQKAITVRPPFLLTLLVVSLCMALAAEDALASRTSGEQLHMHLRLSR